MNTNEILREIERLPVTEKLLLIELTLKSIRENAPTTQLKEAAEEMYEDYLNDKELTAFTVLDSEPFLPINN